MISYKKLFFQLLSRRSQLNVYTKLYYCENVSIKINGYDNVIKTIKGISYGKVHPKTLPFLFNDMEDIKLSDNDWDDIRKNVFEQTDSMFVSNRFPALILDAFLLNEKPNLINSFLDYMLKCKDFHNVSVILSILIFMLSNKITENAEEFVKIYLEKVTKEEFEVLFDKFIFVYLNSHLRCDALKMLSKRERDISILKSICMTSPESEPLNDIMDYFTELVDKENDPINQQILLNVFNKIPSFNIEMLKNVLNLLSKNRKFIWLSSILSIETLTKSMGLQIKFDTVLRLTCKSCGSNIPHTIVDRKTCSDIADNLMVDVMKINTDEELYQNSSPNEILRFEKFVKTCKFPFDCVIDFPNLVNIRKNNRTPMTYEALLRETANNIVQLNKANSKISNICLVGKFIRSLYKTPDRFADDLNIYFKEKYSHSKTYLNISVYLSDRITKDDVLSLYIALKSGPNCFIVTNDEFRDHRARVTDRFLKRSLIDWQNSRQILINTNFWENSRFLMPDLYMKSVSFDEATNTYHIPYAKEIETRLEKTSFSTNVKWACLKL